MRRQATPLIMKDIPVTFTLTHHPPKLGLPDVLVNGADADTQTLETLMHPGCVSLHLPDGADAKLREDPGGGNRFRPIILGYGFRVK